MIARAPEFPPGAERRPAAVDRGRETLSDLQISESEIDVPDFLK